MKIKNITVGIKSPEEGLKEFSETVKAIQRGESPKKKEGLFFVDLEAMRKVLTSKRLQLLHIIRDKHPESIYALAQIVKRDLKNVRQDITLLSRMGLVSLSRKSAVRDRMTPMVGYDNLQLRIPVA